MKNKIITVTIGLFCFINGVNSQIFKGGVLLGVNGCQVDGDGQSGYDKFGLMGGAFIYTPLSRNLDLQFEIEYMGKGAQAVNNDEYGTQTEFTISLNYIELPVIVRLNTIKNFSFEAGLGFGYLFSSSQTLSYYLNTNTFTFNTFELSGILGIGYKINDSFSILARYSYSFTEIAHTYTNPNDLFLASGLYNNLFSIALCYQFP
jgi:hypothetical protein